MISEYTILLPEGGLSSVSSLRSWLSLFGYSVYIHSRGSWARLLAKHNNNIFMKKYLIKDKGYTVLNVF